MRVNVLYVFGGEKALGAEIITERLLNYNFDNVNAHLVMSPGEFASRLRLMDHGYSIECFDELRKLNRSSTNKLVFFFRALRNYVMISYKLMKYIRKNNIKIVQAITIVPASYILSLLLVSKIILPDLKWVWSDYDLVYFTEFENKILSRLCVKMYNKTLAASEAVKNKYPRSSKISTFYNGLELGVFKPFKEKRETFRIQNKIGTDEIVIGLAGVISVRKGQLQLIKVFNRLHNYVNLPIRLLLAGTLSDDSPVYNSQVITAVEASDFISYIGNCDDMVSFYNGCDIIVNNTNTETAEPLGTTIYEAMACEKIVIASNTGGTNEIISDGCDGYLFEAENLQILENLLLQTIKNIDGLQHIRMAARKKVQSKFNLENNIIEYNKLLIDLIK